MATITNNGRTLIQDQNTDRVRSIFDKLAGRTMHGTLYEMYLEAASRVCGLENGWISLIVDGKCEDTTQLIEFCDGKRVPKCAQPINHYGVKTKKHRHHA